MPILKNLSKKKKRGNYQKGLASRAFMYLIDDGAKRYTREYGGNVRDMFPKRQRQMLSKDYAEEFEDIFKNQEFDFMK
jgi:methenyltetrahydromethanopterin cyclohydrolase